MGKHICGRSDDVSLAALSNGAGTGPIKVAVYNGTERPFETTTGVGKHVQNMVCGLANEPDFSVVYYVPTERWPRDQLCPPSERAYSLPSVRMPVTRRRHLIESYLPHPPAFENYAPDADWVYAPMEVYCATRRAKVAVTFHDVYHFEPEHRSLFSPRYAWTYLRWSRALHHADVVFTVSHFTKDRIREIFGTDEQKLVVVGNGVEQVFFGIAAEDPEIVSPLPNKYYLSVGGVTRKKGAHHLLSFAGLLERYRPSQRLVVIGPVEAGFKAAVAAQKNLVLVDRGGDDLAVARWTRGAVAMLCFSEYEGFGIPAAEAMAAGTPVVAHRQGALMEILGDAGLIIDCRAPSELRSVLDIEDDGKYRDRLIELGRARASRYRWPNCFEALAAELRARR